MPEAHSKYSASNFEADALCPGRPVMQRGLPDRSSEYADEGTAAHTLLKWVVEGDKPALAFKGRRINIEKRRTFEVTTEMASAVQTATDHFAGIVDSLGKGMVLSDRRVTYAEALAVPADDGWGTLDLAAVCGGTLVVADYKHGMGVEVRASNAGGPNMQMALYALGLLAAIGDSLGPFDDVLLVILQPRINDEPSTYRLTVTELLEWAERVARPAVVRRVNAEISFSSQSRHPTRGDWEAAHLSPNDKSCKFCKAKATCPALRSAITEPVYGTAVASPAEFEVLPPAKTIAQHLTVADSDWLAAVYPKLDMIVDWTKAVLAEIERRAFAGSPVPGTKIVQGKRGNRQWLDLGQAEAVLSANLGPDAYEPPVLISPTAAEKALGKAAYKAVAHLVTQSDGRQHVAPADDPRPAITVRPIAGDFEVLGGTPN